MDFKTFTHLCVLPVHGYIKIGLYGLGKYTQSVQRVERKTT